MDDSQMYYYYSTTRPGGRRFTQSEVERMCVRYMFRKAIWDLTSEISMFNVAIYMYVSPYISDNFSCCPGWLNYDII